MANNQDFVDEQSPRVVFRLPTRLLERLTREAYDRSIDAGKPVKPSAVARQLLVEALDRIDNENRKAEIAAGVPPVAPK